jgi:uncharacterized protein
MRALLDVNTLIALVDPQHAFFEKAHQWFANQQTGVATCAIVQNGAVRVIAQMNYAMKMRQSVSAAMGVVRDFCSDVDHVFWHQDVQLVDPLAFDEAELFGPKQITDAYLLAVAVKNDGVFVTFDAGVSVHAVRGATSRHLLVL